MSNDILNRIKQTLDQKVQEKKQLQQAQDNLGWFSILIDNAVQRFGEVISKLKIESPVVNVSPPVVNVPEIKIPDIKIPDVIVPEIKVPTINLPTINIPEIKVPDIVIPEIKLPTINVPEPKVTVNIPEIKVPEIKMPDEMNVKGWVSLMGVDLNNPLPVHLRDSKGNPIDLKEILASVSSGGGGGGGGSELSEIPSPEGMYAAVSSDSTALEAGRIVKSSYGVLYGFSGYNSSGNSYYIHVYDSSTQPAEGTVPVIVLKSGASGNFSYDGGKFGKYFSRGIVITNSTTVDSKVLGYPECWFNVLFR